VESACQLSQAVDGLGGLVMSRSSKKAEWNALCLDDLPRVLAEELSREIPNRAALAAWLQVYFKERILQAGTGAPSADNDHFMDWLWYQYEHTEIPIFGRRFPKSERVVSLTFSNKVNSIAQRHCSICNPNDINDAFPIYDIPLRILGRSRQAMRAHEFHQYQVAIRHHLQKRESERKRFNSYCMSLTFVLNRAFRDRDIDNMSKALIDATSRAMGFDDRHVHHLDAVKLIFPDAEEQVRVRLAPSFVNMHDDVALSEHRQSWAGQPPLLPAKLNDVTCPS
jgi:Holliday junction resolvase RusA-like endonuclease